MEKRKWNMAYKARLDDLIQHIATYVNPGLPPDHPEDAAFNNLLKKIERTLQNAIKEGF